MTKKTCISTPRIVGEAISGRTALTQWLLYIICPAMSNVIIGIRKLYHHQHFVCYNLLCSQMGPLAGISKYNSSPNSVFRMPCINVYFWWSSALIYYSILSVLNWEIWQKKQLLFIQYCWILGDFSEPSCTGIHRREIQSRVQFMHFMMLSKGRKYRKWCLIVNL